MKINMETIGYSERETMNAQVETIAKQYLHQGLSLAELIDEGNLGYRKAVETFDEEKHKISLSIRALLNEAKAAARAAVAEEAEDAEAGDELVYEVNADGEASGNAEEFTEAAEE